MAKELITSVVLPEDAEDYIASPLQSILDLRSFMIHAMVWGTPDYDKLSEPRKTRFLEIVNQGFFEECYHDSKVFAVRHCLDQDIYIHNAVLMNFVKITTTDPLPKKSRDILSQLIQQLEPTIIRMEARMLNGYRPISPIHTNETPENHRRPKKNNNDEKIMSAVAMVLASPHSFNLSEIARNVGIQRSTLDSSSKFWTRVNSALQALGIDPPKRGEKYGTEIVPANRLCGGGWRRTNHRPDKDGDDYEK